MTLGAARLAAFLTPLNLPAPWLSGRMIACRGDERRGDDVLPSRSESWCGSRWVFPIGSGFTPDFSRDDEMPLSLSARHHHSSSFSARDRRPSWCPGKWSSPTAFFASSGALACDALSLSTRPTRGGGDGANAASVGILPFCRTSHPVVPPPSCRRQRSVRCLVPGELMLAVARPLLEGGNSPPGCCCGMIAACVCIDRGRTGPVPPSSSSRASRLACFTPAFTAPI